MEYADRSVSLHEAARRMQSWHVDFRCKGCEFLGYPRRDRNGNLDPFRRTSLGRMACCPQTCELTVRGPQVSRFGDKVRGYSDSRSQSPSVELLT